MLSGEGFAYAAADLVQKLIFPKHYSNQDQHACVCRPPQESLSGFDRERYAREYAESEEDLAATFP